MRLPFSVVGVTRCLSCRVRAPPDQSRRQPMSDYVSLNRVHTHTSRKREVMAGIALLVSIAGFVLQTETLGVVGELGYAKPMLVMYITHSCEMLLLPTQIFVLWLRVWISRRETLASFYAKHTGHLRATAVAVARRNRPDMSARRYCVYTAAVLAVAVNLAGASWYVAVNMTTTADLTAIYNCSTFFAYAFSVWLLHERVHTLKVVSVLLSVLGVFVVAYLGSGASDASASGRRRVWGNVIIAAGTVLYGLYEVLYKKIACPPQTVSAKKQAAFASAVGTAIGVGTVVLMWPLLIVLHFGGWETFAVPSARVAGFLALSIVGNVAFFGSFLVLMSLTSPVLGSVSSLLATCAVPVVNYAVWREKITVAEFIGGLLIVGAFVLLLRASADDFVEEDSPADDGV